MKTPFAPDETAPASPHVAVKEKQGFFKKHYGNPEKDEIYGVTSNDYETEADQIDDEKKSAGQAIWFLAAAALLTLLAYGLQQIFLMRLTT